MRPISILDSVLQVCKLIQCYGNEGTISNYSQIFGEHSTPLEFGKKTIYYQPEERGVLEVGNIPVTILPSWQDVNNIAI